MNPLGRAQTDQRETRIEIAHRLARGGHERGRIPSVRVTTVIVLHVFAWYG